MRILPTALLLTLSLTASALAQSIPYDTTPNWESVTSGIATGGAFADIDRDGWPDLVVANGNDIQRQRVEVYYNQGGGEFNTAPDWTSNDVDYHGHLSVGDVNDDGWPDVAVAVFLGPGGFGSFGGAKLYLNNGAGTLSSNPSWQSADAYYCFSVRLGDADGDGDLDLAAATGEPYYGSPTKDRIYLNSGGALATSPGWQSTEIEHNLDCTFADVDEDGDLDLVTCGARAPNRIYFSSGGLVATTSGWASTDNNNQNGNSLTVGDVNGDGRLDLMVTDNNQLSGGQGVFKIYAGSGSSFATTPYWSAHGGNTSSITATDLLLDGYADVIGGIWFGKARIYSNTTGTPSTTAAWQMTGSSVQEAMFLADLNRDGLHTATGESHPVNGVRKVFRLGHAPAASVLAVRADGVVLPDTGYCFDLEEGWLSLGTAPVTSLSIDYQWSDALDLGVTNWDTSEGNYIWLRHHKVRAVLSTPPAVIHEGQTLAFSIEIENTTAISQAYLAGGYFEFPFGGTFILHL
ncbi:MAG: VCBS repeat-containing protein, partial [Planctomycetota bacterium]